MPLPPRPRAKAVRRGLTDEQVRAQIAAQGGVCLLCRRVPDRWDIDHDHSCPRCGGEVGCARCFRGMLCRQCNSGLGFFRDDVSALLRAVAYLRASRGERPDDHPPVREDPTR